MKAFKKDFSILIFMILISACNQKNNNKLIGTWIVLNNRNDKNQQTDSRQEMTFYENNTTSSKHMSAGKTMYNVKLDYALSKDGKSIDFRNSQTSLFKMEIIEMTTDTLRLKHENDSVITVLKRLNQ